MSSITLMTVGDVMLARRVGKMIAEHGATFPFCHVTATLSEGDACFANLESPLSRCGTLKRAAPGKPVFRGPIEAANGLREARFDIVSLANNHIFDYGEAAFRETLETLNSVGVHPVGAGLNLQEALTPAILQVRGSHIAFLAFCNARAATGRSPGTAPLEPNIMCSAIRSARAQANWVVVSFHQGIEYSDYPTSATISLARQMIDAGADVVVGHHPHVLQGIERYANGLIAYSLGNFVFDQHDADLKQQALARSVMTRIGGRSINLADDRMAESIILQVSLSTGQPPSYTVLPVRINDQYQPVLMGKAKADSLSKRLDRLSAPLSDPNAPQIRAIDAIALRAQTQKLWRSPSAFLQLRPRHLRFVWRTIAHRVRDRK